MKKRIKKLLLILSLLVLAAAALLAAWAFLLYPRLYPDAREDRTMDVFTAIAAGSEHIDFDESEGLLYVNNEVVVFVSASAAPEQITAMAKEFHGELDRAMADIGVYRLILRESMTYEELESLLGKIKREDIVEDAYLNLVFPVEEDALAPAKEDSFDYKDPLYPEDDWNGDGWDQSAPRGENWGMEAIHAPDAWGYLDQMSQVRVGLIDSVPDSAHEDLTLAGSTVLSADADTLTIGVSTGTFAPADHGTHVAGTIAADWNNGQGVAGVMGDRGELYYSVAVQQNSGGGQVSFSASYMYLLELKTLIDQDVQAINISQHTGRLIGFAASHGNQNAISYLIRQAQLTENALARIVAQRQAEGKPDFVICTSAGNSNRPSSEYYPDESAAYGYREERTWWENIKHAFGWRGESGGSEARYNNFLNLMTKKEAVDRVVVVGAVGIDEAHSSPSQTKYSYADFSCIGSRVDVAAPGVDVYSCVPGGYERMDGTSMSCPHVTGTAGLVFACNPDLTGPEVKEILRASVTGRYYYQGGSCGLIDAGQAVVTALKTREQAVSRVLQATASGGLDLCFVVDTTGSMGDDIDNAKENITDILEHLAEKTDDYRVALIDYRDFSSRSGSASDYPSKVQLDFTSDKERIESAVQALDLGYGGDDEETVYSALMAAVGLEWRSSAKKVIIILGDAAPLDPEPVTQYTYDDVLLALFNADIGLDIDSSDERVVGSFEDSLISVYSIGTDASTDAEDFFLKIAGSTGGSYAGIDDASEVSDTIIKSIEQIELTKTVRADLDFGADMANEQIDLYLDGEYLFSFETDLWGRAALGDMAPGDYYWSGRKLYTAGTVEIEEGERTAAVRTTRSYWFTPIQRYWQQQRPRLLTCAAGVLAGCVLLPILAAKVRKKLDTRKRPAGASVSSDVPPGLH